MHSEATMNEAKLSGVILRQNDLIEANLSEAKLKWASLSEADVIHLP